MGGQGVWQGVPYSCDIWSGAHGRGSGSNRWWNKVLGGIVAESVADTTSRSTRRRTGGGSVLGFSQRGARFASCSPVPSLQAERSWARRLTHDIERKQTLFLPPTAPSLRKKETEGEGEGRRKLLIARKCPIIEQIPVGPPPSMWIASSTASSDQCGPSIEEGTFVRLGITRHATRKRCLSLCICHSILR